MKYSDSRIERPEVNIRGEMRDFRVEGVRLRFKGGKMFSGEDVQGNRRSRLVKRNVRGISAVESNDNATVKRAGTRSGGDEKLVTATKRVRSVVYLSLV